MRFFHILFIHADNFLIRFYRLADIPIIGYLAGNFCLALICVMAGQLTLYAVWKCNRKWLGKDSNEMVRMHNLSIRALAAKDKTAYKACNKEANEAFGKYFFAQMAMGMSSLWPVALGMGWLDTRFADVKFLLPFGLPSTGYIFTFIPAYILVHILFGRIKRRLPFFGHMEIQMKADAESREKMLTLGDISDVQEPAGRTAEHAG